MSHGYRRSQIAGFRPGDATAIALHLVLKFCSDSQPPYYLLVRTAVRFLSLALPSLITGMVACAELFPEG